MRLTVCKVVYILFEQVCCFISASNFISKITGISIWSASEAMREEIFKNNEKDVVKHSSPNSLSQLTAF